MSSFETALLSTVLTALVVGPTSAWVALLRFRSEKWWERRAQAYISIIEALHDINVELEALIDEELTKNELTPEWKKELSESAVRASFQLAKQHNIGTLLISKRVQELLDRYYVETGQALRKESFFDIVDEKASVVRTIRDKIIEEARSDLQVDWSPMRWLRRWRKP